MKNKEMELNLPIVNESNIAALNDKWNKFRLLVLKAIPKSITDSTNKFKFVWINDNFPINNNKQKTQKVDPIPTLQNELNPNFINYDTNYKD